MMAGQKQEIVSLKRSIAHNVLEILPKDIRWAGLLLRYQELSDHNQTSGFYLDKKEKLHTFVPVPTLLSELHHLRRAMYTPELGAWWSMKLLISVDRQVKFSFNYQDKPIWQDVTLSEIDYKKDLRKFPRPPGQVPQWTFS